MDILGFISEFWKSTGIYTMFTGSGWQNLIMILVGLIFLYLAVVKDFEPYLLVPISFGIILVNLLPEIYITYNEAGEVVGRGLLGVLHIGVEHELYPCLIFLGIGATTDFGPLISNKKTMLLGAAAQIGIFVAFFGALLLGFNFYEASSIGIIGGADGPTAILTSNRLLTLSHSEQYLAPIALAAYSYMALVPIIFPPVIHALTTKEERLIKMEQLRSVNKTEKILFPIVVTLIVSLLVPSATPLIGCLMLGNLIKECGVVPNLLDTLSNSLLYICTILLGLSVGATANGTSFLTFGTLKIFALGITAFVVAAAFGILGGKVMCKMTGGKVNPMIGAAGVSAVPMAARVVQKEGVKEDPSNFLLMHAMGPNVAGVIGSAIAAGILLTIFG